MKTFWQIIFIVWNLASILGLFYGVASENEMVTLCAMISLTSMTIAINNEDSI